MLFLVLLLVVSSHGETEKKRSRLESSVAEHEYVVSLFHEAGCERCLEFAPVYQILKMEVKKEHGDLDFEFLEIEIGQEPEYKEQLNLNSEQLPVLMIFHDGIQNAYDGPFQQEYVSKYIDHRTKKISQLLTPPQIEDYLSQGESQVVILYNSPDSQSQGFRFYLNATYDFDGIEFAHSFDASQPERLLVRKPFDEKSEEFLEVTDEVKLREFIYDTSIPSFSKFDELKMNLLFHKGDPMLFLFMEPSHTQEFNAFTEVAPLYKSKDLRFAYVQPDDPVYQQLKSDIFAFTELPFVALLIKYDEQFYKFKFNYESVTTHNLNSFVEDYLNQKIDPYFKSEPEDSDEVFETSIVKKLTTSNFYKVVQDHDKDVVVLFYAPWCSHCAQFKPFYQSVAEKFNKAKGFQDLLFGQIDDTKNEIIESGVVGYPTVFLYKKLEKSDPIPYEGTREEEDFIEFLETSLGRQIEKEDL